MPHRLHAQPPQPAWHASQHHEGEWAIEETQQQQQHQQQQQQAAAAAAAAAAATETWFSLPLFCTCVQTTIMRITVQITLQPASPPTQTHTHTQQERVNIIIITHTPTNNWQQKAETSKGGPQVASTHNLKQGPKTKPLN